MTRVSARCLAVATAVLLAGLPIRAGADDRGPIDLEQLDAERRKSMRKWSVDSKTGERLTDGLEFLEEERYEEARKKIERIALRRANPYERAMVYRVLAFVDLYTGSWRKQFEAGFRRSGGHVDMIQRVFEEEGVPLDLTYMAHVESSFKPKALSRARAYGMWQFMAATGRSYGLSRGHVLPRLLSRREEGI